MTRVDSDNILTMKLESVAFVYVADNLPLSAANEVHLPSGSKEYLGMLEYKKEDEAKIIQNLILGSQTYISGSCFLFENLKINQFQSPGRGLFFISLFLHGFSPSLKLPSFSANQVVLG